MIHNTKQQKQKMFHLTKLYKQRIRKDFFRYEGFVMWALPKMVVLILVFW